MKSYLKILEKKLFGRFLMNLSQPGCYAIINEKHKMFHIKTSQNVLTSLATTLSDIFNKTYHIKQLSKDLKYINIKLLQLGELKDEKVTRLKWYKLLLSKGYKPYTLIASAHYTKKAVLLDNGKAQVRLVTRGKRAVPIKDFNSMQEAIEYMDSNTEMSLLEDSAQYEA